MDILLRKISVAMMATAQNQAEARKYYEMQQTPGWQIYLNLLKLIRGQMFEDMLGKEFTKMPSVDKDIQQRAYAKVDEVLHFLADPLEESRKLQKIKRHNAAMAATVPGATKITPEAT
jgi:hypothetical protein